MSNVNYENRWPCVANDNGITPYFPYVVERNEQPYEFQTLDRYSISERLQIRAIGFTAYLLIKLIGITVKFQEIDKQNLDSVRAAGRVPILSFWHDRIIPSTYFFRDQGIIVLSSQSYDSEFTARVIQRFGFGIVKGSSTRGAVSGLVGMIRMMKDGMTTGFTVDGPKGPKYEAKAGPVLLAKKTGNPMLPFVVECKSFWRLQSWDRLRVPNPFSSAAVFYGAPIYVDAKAGDEDIESKRIELQNSLAALVQAGEEWRMRS